MNERHVRAYLERLGYHAEPDGSVRMAEDLMQAHLTHVPGENLYIYDAMQIPSLDPEKLYHKIVSRQEGGVCLELNTLFCDLLCSLGIRARTVMARVIEDAQTTGPMNHLSLLAEMEDRIWLCDVGLDIPGPVSMLPLQESSMESTGENFFWTKDRELWTLNRRTDAECKKILQVCDRPATPAEVDQLNHMLSGNPGGRYTNHRFVQKYTEFGRKQLLGNTLTVEENGSESVAEARDDRELCEILAREFGLPAPDPEKFRA